MKKKINIVKIAVVILVLYFFVESILNAFYFVNNYVLLQKKKQELERLKQAQQELKQKIEYAKTDEFIEKYARENLGLAKPNETVIYFKLSDDSKEQTQNFSKNFFENLLNLFKN
ncbi:FtsB family cell division protein [Caldisericum exile]|uniref:Septum formation initiator family protein n=1 Tax=Caldisericum exile (strain DSM 21853 / NBRC 104410 / AZM16c01) TaxID=511051 RepID=A0A7U6GEB0_CALEA|nr:septum formation initiator family protein [Caldisericum exile]BAL80807.1 septum formation initiator family protein [Caldisericum exile AZM16c01]